MEIKEAKRGLSNILVRAGKLMGECKLSPMWAGRETQSQWVYAAEASELENRHLPFPLEVGVKVEPKRRMIGHKCAEWPS